MFFFMLKIYECMKDEDDVNGISITNVKSSDTSYTRTLEWCYRLVTMTTVASCARSVNDLHYALLRHPLRSPRPHVAVTSECCARVTSRFSLLDPLSYRENRCNSTSILIVSSEFLLKIEVFMYEHHQMQRLCNLNVGSIYN
jgi:hypothetical protein